MSPHLFFMILIRNKFLGEKKMFLLREKPIKTLTEKNTSLYILMKLLTDKRHHLRLVKRY